MIKRINRTLFELICGILVFGVLAQIVLFILVIVLKNRNIPTEGIWSVSKMYLGLWLGVISSVLMSIHMWWSLDRALEYDEKTASRKMSLNYTVRYVFVIAVLALVCITKAVNPIVCFVGLMGTKIGAYLNKPMKLFSNQLYGVEVVSEETVSDGGENEGESDTIVPSSDRVEAMGNGTLENEEENIHIT